MWEKLRDKTIRSELRNESWHHQDDARRSLCSIFSPSYRLTQRLTPRRFLSIWARLLFSPNAHFRGGIGAKRPNGVSVSVVDRAWVTGLAYPHHHDAACNNRLTGLPVEATQSVRPALCSVCVCVLYLCGCVCGGGNPHSCPVCAVMSAMQHFFFPGVSIVYVVCLDASQSCLLDERITGTAGNRGMIFWLYSTLSGWDTAAITGTLLHLLPVKCSPEICTNGEKTYGYKYFHSVGQWWVSPHKFNTVLLSIRGKTSFISDK